MTAATRPWCERTELLLGPEKNERLRQSHVLVVGLGGVGAYAAEMIARAGVDHLTIVDADYVSPSNINRQLVALHSATDRLLDATPRYDFVVDAIDTLAPKVNLIKGCLDRSIPLVSSMGAGAKTDPTLVEIRDIGKSHHCPLAHMLRKRLHKLNIRSGFPVVFSPEPVREGSLILCEEQNKKSNVGTISYMPAVFGCACASVAIRTLLGEMQ